MRKVTGLALSFGVVVSAVLLAQTADKPPAEKPPQGQIGGLRFRDVAEVTVVNVDVSVSDRKGPIRGLQPSDFEVYQDGRLQDISNFAFYQREGPAEAPAVPPTAVPTAAPSPTPAAEPAAPRREPRFMALYVDNQNLAPFDRNRVVNKVSEWIRNNLAAPDQAMVVSYQRSLKIMQPFTSDPEDIADALRTTKTYTGGRTEVNSSRRDIENAINQSGNQGSDPNRSDSALGRVRAFAREQRNDLMFTIRALQDLVTMMSGLPGKKSVIYVSDGLPMTPGLELFYEIQDKLQDTSAVSQSHDFEASSLYRGLVTSAAAAGVTFYTIDARGLESELGNEAENQQARSTLAASIGRTNYQDSLVYIAEQTGGLAIVNTNDVMPGLNRIADDLETYYSLGYRLVPSGQDRIHRIEVKIKGHPEYRLNYRHTFIEKSLPTRIADRVMTGLAFDLSDNPMGITLSAGDPTPASSGRWALPVEIKVPIAKIALVPDGDELTGYVMAYYAARDDEGKQSDLQNVEHVVRVPKADYEKAKHEEFTFTASLLLEPGRYRISVGVRDELTNQAGYAGLRKLVHPGQT
ncbi:MAG: VWA domain-containing protein [Acidobacteriota bacterium]